jgi:hypothetical protein
VIFFTTAWQKPSCCIQVLKVFPAKYFKVKVADFNEKLNRGDEREMLKNTRREGRPIVADPDSGFRTKKKYS